MLIYWIHEFLIKVYEVAILTIALGLGICIWCPLWLIWICLRPLLKKIGFIRNVDLPKAMNLFTKHQCVHTVKFHGWACKYFAVGLMLRRKK